VRFQEIRQGDRSTFNYFAILLDPDTFGLEAPELLEALQAENIGSRRYFHPPLHRQRIYAEAAAANGNLAITDRVANGVLCLPLFTHLPMRDLEKVAEAVAEIQAQAPAVRAALARPLARTAGGTP
jgi:dTDP-4-amino-4,6-dideoxygalactose transaminase